MISLYFLITDLSDRQQQQQTALWELIKTEVAYIKTLNVVTDVSINCIIILNLQTQIWFKLRQYR